MMRQEIGHLVPRGLFSKRYAGRGEGEWWRRMKEQGRAADIVDFAIEYQPAAFGPVVLGNWK